MKIAIVHDWLVTYTGAEKVLKAILELYPDADLFALADFMEAEARGELLADRPVATTFIQRLPFAKKHFRNYLPFFPAAVESIDVSGYDLVISSSWAVAKGVKTREDQLHICYCHTPIRYAWDLYDEYTARLPFGKKQLVQLTLKYLRRWDRDNSDGVNAFIANSEWVSQRIARTYGRESVVIHPPVDTRKYRLQHEKQEYYFTASRLVSYKKIGLIVEAFNATDKPLIVAGKGEELEAIRRLARPNVTVLGYVDDAKMVELMQHARAFVFAALEDFGIIPIEAMACGTPVIAFDQGGTGETVLPGKTGVHFHKQDAASIRDAVASFESATFDPEAISKYANGFDVLRFKRQFREFVEKQVAAHAT